MDKPTTRRTLLEQLRAMNPESRALASAGICLALARSEIFQRARTVFSFLPMPIEPDLRSLLSEFPEKIWGFPRVMDGEWMCFHHLTSAAEAIAGSHGIREPDPMVHPLIDVADADLVLVPGLGFDPETRARIGRGKGYYDRYLSGYGGAAKPCLVGIAFSTQLTRLMAEEHDVPMQHILTEQGWG